MGIIAWIAVGLIVGLLVNMLLPGISSRGLIFTGLTGITAILGGAWTASLFRAHGLGSFPGWLAALAEVAVLLLACHLLTRPPGGVGSLTHRFQTPDRWDIPEGSL
jgi:uncharacterized membrane protein YeaQ/YmgE (transglycosylase-associated protein family)